MACFSACGGRVEDESLQVQMFAPITAEATSAAGAVVTVPTPTANVSGATVECGVPTGTPSSFPLGTTPVSCTATDPAGRTASGSSSVTVVDTTAPALTMFAPITVAATSAAGTVLTLPVPATSDATGVPTLVCDVAPGSPTQLPVGTTTVHCTARDSAGNAATGTSTVTVRALSAASGVLDPSFATVGYLITTPGLAQSVVVQPDGKIIVLTGSNTGGASFTLMRFNADGSADASFGIGGRALGDLGSGAQSEDANSLVLQSDGKLVVGGTGYPAASGHSVMALARFDASGHPDLGFGSAGKGFAFSVPAFLRALVLQADGKLVAAGAIVGAHNTQSFALARFLPSGALDAGFGSGGTIVTDFSGSGNDSVAESLALQSDGKILAAGWNAPGPSSEYPALIRYNADGSIDTGFGIAGKVSNQTLSGTDNAIARVALQADGKIVLSRGVDSGGGDLALTRYNVDGSADTSFGVGGVTTVDFAGGSQDLSNSLTIQGDGRIVVGGSSSRATGALFTLARFRPDGTLDASFGNAGWATIDFSASSSSDAAVRALAIQPDGAIVAVGGIGGTSSAIARFTP